MGQKAIRARSRDSGRRAIGDKNSAAKGRRERGNGQRRMEDPERLFLKDGREFQPVCVLLGMSY